VISLASIQVWLGLGRISPSPMRWSGSERRRAAVGLGPGPTWCLAHGLLSLPPPSPPVWGLDLHGAFAIAAQPRVCIWRYRVHIWRYRVRIWLYPPLVLTPVYGEVPTPAMGYFHPPPPYTGRCLRRPTFKQGACFAAQAASLCWPNYSGLTITIVASL
jgi:hypothetical protein